MHGQEFVTPASPLEKTFCVTVLCVAASSQTCHVGLISQVERLVPLLTTSKLKVSSDNNNTAKSERPRLERNSLLKMLGDHGTIWQKVNKKQGSSWWHLYSPAQRGRKDHWPLNRGRCLSQGFEPKEAQNQQFPVMDTQTNEQHRGHLLCL